MKGRARMKKLKGADAVRGESRLCALFEIHGWECMSRMRGANASRTRERGLAASFSLHRHGRVERFRRLDEMDAAQTRPQSRPDLLPSPPAAHQRASVQRREVERAIPAQRLEHRAAQQAVELAAMEG